ncbi:MAG: hypothetical protein SFZ02_20245, partial [bacterium]|nr:hypothetical protein [bacterium]
MSNLTPKSPLQTGEGTLTRHRDKLLPLLQTGDGGRGDEVNALKYAIIIIPALLAVALYGYTIRLPLFLDDGPQFRMVEVFDGFSHWLGSLAYFYYRPAVFSMWKLSSVLAGGFDAAGLHWLNVMLFGMTGSLLSAITYRLMPKNKAVVALGVGVGFIIFPFNYQTVILVGAMF